MYPEYHIIYLGDEVFLECNWGRKTRGAKMKTMLMGTVAAIVLGVGSAVAADIPLKAPAANPYLSWTGFYIGAQAGTNYGTTQSVYGLPGQTLTGRAINDKYHPVGLLLGGTAGVNWQIGNIVIGAEGDIGWTNKRDSAHDIAPFNTSFFEQFDEKWLATYRGRVGFVFGSQGNWMIYGTGGGASASVNIAVNSGGGARISETRTLNGWTAGGGIETLLGPNWSLKSEVLFVRFDDKAYFTPAPNPLFLSNRVIQTDQLISRVGINYRFGPMGW
jgi:outer membrane immunogenic protein